MNILAIHGYNMNGEIMKSMCTPLLKRLDYNINLITPDAPFLIKDSSCKEITTYFKPPYYQWFNKSQNIDIDILNILDNIDNINNIDGIIGFSQGAYVSSIISSYIKPKFVICIAGVEYNNNNNNNIIKIPSFHIIGKNDIDIYRSINLTKRFENAEIIYHQDGHHFPKNMNIYTHLNYFIKNSMNSR